jgi:hypothetical protein
MYEHNLQHDINIYMTQVVAVTTQHVLFPGPTGYFPGQGVCTPFMDCNRVNGILDWEYTSVNNGGNFCFFQPVCSQVDQSNGTCPQIGGPMGGTIAWNGTANVFSQSQGRLVNCGYDVTAFKTSTDIQNWINVFCPNNVCPPPVNGIDNNAAFNLIMENFCPQQAATGHCQAYPISPTSPTGICVGGLTGCSRFSSVDSPTNTDGSLCRTWAAKNGILANTASSTFCGANLCANDCLCFNRGKVDELYILITMASTTPITDACWFKPCQEEGVYLIPDDQNISGTGHCPSTICQQVINIIDNSSSTINITVAQQSISCNITPSGGGTGGQTWVQSIWDQYGTYIIIFTVIIVIIIFILIIVAVMNGDRSPSKEIEPPKATLPGKVIV